DRKGHACPPGRIRRARKALAGSVHPRGPGYRRAPGLGLGPRTDTGMRSIWIYLLILLGTALVYEAVRTSPDRISYGRFRDLAESGQLGEVEIRADAYVARSRP